jgi:hypothetical protein
MSVSSLFFSFPSSFGFVWTPRLVLTKRKNQTDPHELTNIYTTDSTSTSTTFPYISPSTTAIPISSLVTRLDALLVVLKTCKARQCTHPWETLHPPPPSGGGRLENSVGGDGDGDGEVVHYFGDVQTMGEALDPKFDGYYRGKGRVVWERCEEAYVRESEGVEFVDRGVGLGDGEGKGKGVGDEGYMWHEVATELD